LQEGEASHLRIVDDVSWTYLLQNSSFTL